MQLKLTPAELRELVIDDYVKIGHLLRMPDGNDMFIPLALNPQSVAINHGADRDALTEVYIKKADL